LAVGSCDWVEVLRDGLGDGFDFSVTVAAEDLGRGLGVVLVVVVRRSVVVVEDGGTLRPGVVTESELAVVAVFVFCVSPSI